MAGTTVKKTTTTPAAKKTASVQTFRGSSAVKKNNNASILSFFKKADGPTQSQSKQPRLTQFGVTVSRSEASTGKNNGLKREDSAGDDLFVEDKNRRYKNLVDIRDDGKTKTTVPAPIIATTEEPKSEETESDRFNESTGSNKKRKLDSPVVKGPFIDESDSEDDDEYSYSDTKPQIGHSEIDDRPPPLVRAATSNFETSAVADDFDDIEDDIEGDESLERAWMQDETEAFGLDNDTIEDGPSCPICQASLVGQSDAVSSAY
jgi:DNA cross-link repair 1A protein